jgi:hypothetical protein
MKIQGKIIVGLVAAGLAMGTTQAIAGGKKHDDLVKQIDADLKRLDKELFGWLKR